MSRGCAGAFFLTIVAAVAATPAMASERQTSNYPHGAENWGTGALPPPGTYLLNYANYITYDRLNDRNGDKAVPDFKVDAYANVVRIVHVTPRKLLGASYAFQVIVPLVDLNVRVGGAHGHDTSIGDVVIDPLILGWRRGDLHITSGIDIFLPTGNYKSTRLANVGRNYISFEPVLALSYLPKSGWDASVKIMYDINTRNRETGYLSGQELHFDYNVGKSLRNGLGLGVAGYFLRQTTDDRLNGSTAPNDGDRGRAFAIGPTVKYQLGKALLIGVWQHETSAENRPQGEKIWFRFITRL